MTEEYSPTSPVTPLAQKLGLKNGMIVWFDNMPNNVRAEIDEAELTLSEEAVPTPGLNSAHLFVTERGVLEKQLAILRDLVEPTGQVWVSWPKKAAKQDTDLTEDTIREVALPMGLVDVKVCAVDDIWSGLKLVIRKEMR